jgi:hypothetical protein
VGELLKEATMKTRSDEPDLRHAHHLILVRRRPHAGGCGGAVAHELHHVSHSGSDAQVAQTGAIYLAVKREFGDRVEVSVVNADEALTLGPDLIRDAVRYRVPIREALRSLAAAGVGSAVLDGVVLSRGGFAEPDVVVRRIRERIGEALTASPAAQVRSQAPDDS